MSELKATPGPWVAVMNEYYFEICNAATGDQVGDACASLHAFDDGDHKDDGYAAANAYLMAAAPDLYEALIQAKKELEEIAVAENGEEYNSPQINSALSKARGEP